MDYSWIKSYCDLLIYQNLILLDNHFKKMHMFLETQNKFINVLDVHYEYCTLLVIYFDVILKHESYNYCVE